MTIFMFATYTGAVAFAVYVYVDDKKELNDDVFYKVVGYFFLGTFVLMAVVNCYLICQMNKKDRLLNH